MASTLPRIVCNQEIIDALTPVPDFKSRDDIKPWVLEKMEPRGINLVIERSDASKVVFKCKNIHRKSTSSVPRPIKTNSSSSLKNGKPAKRIRNVPEDSCPFRLRVSYSVKHKIWAVNVIKFEHNPALCCNFADHYSSAFSPSSTTPGSTKRSWSYTPVSTVSPAFSSPATGSFTPASETSGYNSYDYLNSDNVKFMKKQRTSTSSNINSSYFDSPLYQETDPLSENLSLLPEDLNDINHFYESSQDLNLINSLPLTNFDTPLDLNMNNNNINYQQSQQQTIDLNQNIFIESFNDQFELNDQKPQLPSQAYQQPSKYQPTTTSSKSPYFKTPMQPIQPLPKPSRKQQPQSDQLHKQISPKPEFSTETHAILTEPLIMHHQQQSYNQQLPTSTDPLNLNLQSISEEVSNEEEEDPLMYLLNVNGGVSTNSSYTLEELENLDKAMGFDANDKLLMSMFQGM